VASPKDKKQSNNPIRDEENEPTTSPFVEEEADGYKRTKRAVERAKKAEAELAQAREELKKQGKLAEKPDPKRPKSGFQRFMDDHWESWLGPVLMLVLAAGFIVSYKADLLRESAVGLIVSGGLVAYAIYYTAIPAYELIKNTMARRLFALLCIVWVAAAGYPTLRKGLSRDILAETVLTKESRTEKLPIKGGKTGPFDITVSGTLKQSGGQDTTVGYTLNLTSDAGASQELNGEFSQKVNQMRARRGTMHWSEQHNQEEHRLPGSFRGKELTVTTDTVDELLESGIHVTVHPQSYDPKWFFLAGILVVLFMMFVETRIGDQKVKPHLIMASASTLVFSYWFHKNATPSRLVAPALDAVLLAAIVGGIGGTLIGAVVRRASGRDRIKPAEPEEKKGDKDDDEDEK
jgi:hypothetical protein